MTDQELIKSILTGSNEAMKELIIRYQDLVLNTCYKVLRSREDAEDIAQEVFIETYRSIATLRSEESLSFWLYRISLNKSINYSKRKGNSLLRSLLHIDSIFCADDDEDTNEIPFSDDNPDSGLEDKEQQDLLVKAVATLPSSQQKAFILCYYENLSYKEICNVMGVSLPAVESLLHRAKMNLQKKCSCYNQPSKSYTKQGNHDIRKR